MDRYLTSKNVMSVLLEEYESKSLEFILSDTPQNFIETKSALETLRGVIEKVINKLPDRYQDKFRERMLSFYKDSAVTATFNLTDKVKE